MAISDYYNMKIIVADTVMRYSIAESTDESPSEPDDHDHDYD